jgi:hypothetical protein
MDSKNKAKPAANKAEPAPATGLGTAALPESGIGPNSAGMAGIGSGYKPEEGESALRANWQATKGHSKLDSSRAKPTGDGGRD